MNNQDNNDEFQIVILVIIVIFLMIVAIVVCMRYRKKNKSRKLEEEIYKLQQYVNQIDRIGNVSENQNQQKSSKLENNTQPQILSQTNSFQKSHRFDDRDPKKIFIELDKSDREIGVSPKTLGDEEEKKQDIKISKRGLNKKKLTIDIPSD